MAMEKSHLIIRCTKLIVNKGSLAVLFGIIVNQKIVSNHLTVNISKQNFYNNNFKNTTILSLCK